MWRIKPGESEAEFRDRKRRMAATMAYKEKGMRDVPNNKIACYDKTNHRWYVQCSWKSGKCSKRVSAVGTIGADSLIAHFKKKSWQHKGGRKWICPDCQSKKHSEHSTGEFLNMDKALGILENHESSIAKAKTAKRQAIAFLEDQFKSRQAATTMGPLTGQ